MNTLERLTDSEHSTYGSPSYLRDQIRLDLIKAALNGLLTCPDVTGTPDKIAAWAIGLADAVLARLEKEGK